MDWDGGYTMHVEKTPSHVTLGTSPAALAVNIADNEYNEYYEIRVSLDDSAHPGTTVSVHVSADGQPPFTRLEAANSYAVSLTLTDNGDWLWILVESDGATFLYVVQFGFAPPVDEIFVRVELVG
jgi:alpha-D-ribose 1-methylphosphonate 5-triphosphate synthase subunit PhnH